MMIYSNCKKHIFTKSVKVLNISIVKNICKTDKTSVISLINKNVRVFSICNLHIIYYIYIYIYIVVVSRVTAL
jgi:hypothetical protein